MALICGYSVLKRPLKVFDIHYGSLLVHFLVHFHGCHHDHEFHDHHDLYEEWRCQWSRGYSVKLESKYIDTHYWYLFEPVHDL